MRRGRGRVSVSQGGREAAVSEVRPERCDGIELELLERLLRWGGKSLWEREVLRLESFLGIFAAGGGLIRAVVRGDG